ncbi:MAG: class I SAM-dependent methyltransferase [Bdellovibrionales bacterium]|nr:class I SAM-dependent methyltransferase [Bdellovibrionales bacterium]
MSNLQTATSEPSFLQQTNPQVPEGEKWEFCGCPLCGASEKNAEVRHVFELSSYVRCQDCNLVYLSPRMKESFLFAEVYDTPTYYGGDEGHGYETYEEEVHIYKKTFEDRVRVLRRFKNSGRVLDIGCGPGLFMDVADSHGFEAHGIDVSNYVVNKRKPEFGDRIVCGTLDTANYPAGYFDAITMFDLIEHIYQPEEFAAQLSEILAPGGIVMAATPNYDSWMRKILGKKTVSFKIPEHVCYFTRETIALAFKDKFKLLHTENIGQHCSVDFLSRRLSDIAPIVGSSFKSAAGVFGLKNKTWNVPSGSLLAVFQKCP